MGNCLSFQYDTAPDPEMTTGNFKLNSIQLKNAQGIVIESATFSYMVTAKKRTFLNRIVFRDTSKNYSFEYITPEQLPERLSKSQDHWGYFNAVNNSSLVPRVANMPNITFNSANREPSLTYTRMGMLKKICYPTKGCTEFDYEANTYWGNRTIPAPVVTDYITVSRPSAIGGGNSTAQSVITLPITQTVKIIASGGFNDYECTPAQDTGHSQTNLSVIDGTTNQAVSIYLITNGTYVNQGTSITLTTNLSNSEFYFFGTEGKTYTIKLLANRACTIGAATVYYYKTRDQIVQDNIVSGGVRVKSVKETDNTITANYRRFFYGRMTQIGKSSGVYSGRPHYIQRTTLRKPCGNPNPSNPAPICTHIDVTHFNISSSSILALYDKGAAIHYPYVTVSYGGDNFEKGAEEHEFIVNADLPGGVLHGGDFNNGSRTNSGWDNGLEKRVVYFRKNTSGTLDPIKETSNTYFRDNRINTEVYSYPVRNNFALDCFTNGEFSSIENLDVMRTVMASNWHYLKSTTATDYFYDTPNGNQSVTTTTNYYYDNPVHLQPTRVETTNSKGEQLMTKTRYPDDIVDSAYLGGDPSTPSEMAAFNRLKTGALHRISEPIQIESYVNGILSGVKKTVYRDWGANFVLPEKIMTIKGTLEFSFTPRVTYNQYDSSGNPVALQLEEGMNVVYLWGYSKTMPIAKIENANFSQVAIALGTDISSLLDFNEVNLPAINGLRTSLPEAMVTTFTYIPLVGIQTVTDPKGDTMTYEYDAFSRLKSVKDHQGNILSSNDYNYRPN